MYLLEFRKNLNNRILSEFTKTNAERLIESDKRKTLN